MKKLTSNKKKPEPQEDLPMAEDKKSELLEKTSQKLAETAAEVLGMYEEYLLDQKDWRTLAKTMTKLRSAISGYYAAGGK